MYKIFKHPKHNKETRITDLLPDEIVKPLLFLFGAENVQIKIMSNYWGFTVNTNGQLRYFKCAYSTGCSKCFSRFDIVESEDEHFLWNCNIVDVDSSHIINCGTNNGYVHYYNNGIREVKTEASFSRANVFIGGSTHAYKGFIVNRKNYCNLSMIGFDTFRDLLTREYKTTINNLTKISIYLTHMCAVQDVALVIARMVYLLGIYG